MLSSCNVYCNVLYCMFKNKLFTNLRKLPFRTRDRPLNTYLLNKLMLPTITSKVHSANVVQRRMRVKEILLEEVMSKANLIGAKAKRMLCSVPDTFLDI